MTPAEQIAWHRREADRIEAEERARRPALAAGQVWRYALGPETNRFWCVLFHVRGELLAVTDRGTVLYDFMFGVPPGFELVGSLARDKLRLVEPEKPAVPQDEPTGEALVGNLCWVRDDPRHRWLGPFDIKEFQPHLHFHYQTESRGWCHAKLYRKGVAP